MFFFFFNKKLSCNPIIQEAFKRVCFDKLIYEGYCDMNPIFDRPRLRKDDITFKLASVNSPLTSVYSQSYAKNIEEIEKILIPVLDKLVLDEITLDDYSMFAIVYYVYKAIPTYNERINITQEMFNEWKNNIADILPNEQNFDLRISEGIVFDNNTIDLYIIKSISSYMNVLEEISNKKSKVFFRGHANLNYKLIPSIFRKEEWLHNEKKMYQELQINCPNELSNMKNHLECLAEMQHYGLPTRLLDITQNPLVALYFACEDQNSYAGEVILFSVLKDNIKYPQSDTVAVLSSLPLFDYNAQKQFIHDSLDKSLSLKDFNDKVARLVQEVRLERPGFKEEILPEDIRKSIVVIPSSNNRRIANQDGAFIICGLLDEIYNNIKKPNSLTEIRAKSKSGKKIVCVVVRKDKLLKQLNSLSVNKAKVYPEIDDVADYIKNHVEEL